MSTTRRRRRPSVTLHCPADAYTQGAHRIVEFSDGNGEGGLISLRSFDDGTLRVEIYRHTAGVKAVVVEPSVHPTDGAGL